MKALVAATFGWSLLVASCPPPSPAPMPDVIVDATPPSTFDALPPAADAAIDVSSPKDAAPKPVSPCQGACDALTRAGCKEGSVADCAAKICQINADPRFKHYNVTCLSGAKTNADVVACGGECTK